MQPRSATLARTLALVCGFCITAAIATAAITPDSLPKPTGYVSDLAHVVSPGDKAELEGLCTKVQQELDVQFALVTIDTLGDQPIRDFALDVFRKWGVGSKKTNQGVLLLLVIKDHTSDIETGRGIEPYITDGFAGSTLRAMRPQLRAGDYGAALLTAGRTMAQQIAQGKGVAFDDALPQREEPRTLVRHRGGIPGPLIILGIFLFLWLLGRGGRGGRRGGGGGFLTGILLGNLLGGGRGGWGGGGWGDGGGFGGGSGGGGFGGFGGGDAGGGGASSNW